MIEQADLGRLADRARPADTRVRVFIDVFAGCGGLSLGLKRAGWTGLLAIEKDAFAFETLDHNFRDEGPLRYYWPDSIERRAWDIHDLLDDRAEALAELSESVTCSRADRRAKDFRRRASDGPTIPGTSFLTTICNS